MSVQFISSFSSQLVAGRQAYLNTLLQGSQNNQLSTSTVQSLVNAPLTPLTQLSGDLTLPAGYNLALNSIAADLSSMYAESNNIWNIFSSIQYLSAQDITNLSLAVTNLENLVSQAVSNSFFNNITFTNNIPFSFTQQTVLENSLEYYQSGGKEQAYIDTKDNLLILPLNGEFLNQLSSTNQIPSSVYMDRVIGTPVSKGNTANYAFDGSLVNYWNEVIHSNGPIYVDNTSYPWLPVVNNSGIGYHGGTACRIKVEFENITQVSELDIRAFGSNPINLLAVGWTSDQNNLLVDPNFTSGITTSDYWYLNSSVFGDTNTGSGNVIFGDGPNGENVVELYTYSSTGSVSLVHQSFSVSNSQGLEVSFLAKSLFNTPIIISLSSISSGNVTLNTVSETIHLNNTSWNSISLSFDQVVGTSQVVLRISIPPNFNTPTNVFITAPFVESINQFLYYENIVSRNTVFLDYPINAKRVYLIFSQENYVFKHYSISDSIDKANWDRLTKPKNSNILDWSQEISRGGYLKLTETSAYSDISLDWVRNLPGTSWENLNKIVQYANPNIEESSFAVYEYEIGAFEIYLRHREYSPQGRYVSVPIQLNGELREVSLQSSDSVVDGITSPNTITYTITAHENDVPEYGKTILSSSSYSFDFNSTFPIPPASIPYLDYTTWNYTSTNFQAIYWQYALQSTQTSNVLLIDVGPNATQGEYIQKILPSPIDLRGASSVTAQYFAFSSQVLNVSSAFNVMFGISSDGVNWIEQVYDAPISDQYDFYGSSSQLLFYPLLLNLTGVQAEQLESIQYLRITCTSTTQYPNDVWIMFNNLATETLVNGGRTIRFFPSDDVTDILNPITDFLCPVRTITDIENGSDRYGRVEISYYPYINRNTIMSLIWGGSDDVPSLSANLNGLRVPYDPNNINPNYLNSSGVISTLTGYRPITVTLQFTNTNQIVGPDSLGKPLPGELFQSVNETLLPATSTTSSQTVLQNTTTSTSNNTSNNGSNISGFNLDVVSSVQGSNSNNSQIVTQSIYPLWQTQYTNIVSGPNGIDFSAFWSNGIASGNVLISPNFISVNSTTGIVTINQSSPGTGYYVVASYWFIIGENSPREYFLGVPSISGGINLSSPQQYPVTRNMTDYLYGTIPVLTPAQTDPLSDNYYPVYEYYIHPDGYLVFSQSLMQYSATPAIVTVTYNTLAIVPRLIIDLDRGQYTSQTPYVSNCQLLCNSRQN